VKERKGMEEQALEVEEGEGLEEGLWRRNTLCYRAAV